MDSSVVEVNCRSPSKNYNEEFQIYTSRDTERKTIVYLLLKLAHTCLILNEP